MKSKIKSGIPAKLMATAGGKSIVILLISSMASMTIGYIGLGLHYYLIANTNVDTVRMLGLSITSIVVVIVPFTIAFGPVMNIFLGEMFAASIKGTAATIITFASALAGFISTFAYQYLIDAIGEIYVFWMYAVFMASFSPALLLLLSETKGKSLQEIQKVLNKK